MMEIMDVVDAHHFKTRIIIGFLLSIKFYEKCAKTWGPFRQDQLRF
jgi:hypothetical protein